LHYVNAKTLGLDEISLIEDIIVYRSNGMIYIKTNDEVLANVKLYDVLGKLLIEQKNILTTATAIKELKETKQVLVVKATSKSGAVYTKKLIY